VKTRLGAATAEVMRAPEVVRETGATYRQLDYWTTKGFLAVSDIEWCDPSGPHHKAGFTARSKAADSAVVKSNPGSGRARIYDTRTVEKVRLMARFAALGVRPSDASRLADGLLDTGAVEVCEGVVMTSAEDPA
jgi:hypothetical protein